VSAATESALPRILKAYEADLLEDWMREQMTTFSRTSKIKEPELRSQSAEFLSVLQQATQSGNPADVTSPAYGRVRDMLGDLSRSRSIQGFSPSETAMFVFSMKRPLFSRIRKELANDVDGLTSATW
jgi:rsbT co-antagonist protein RsbR